MRTVVQWLEHFFRHTVVYPLLRLILHNPPVTLPIDIKKIRKILILRYDRIGDIVVTGPTFRLIKRANPGIVLGVFASQANAELILHDPHVDKVHILHSNWITLAKEIIAAHREGYDIVLNLIFNRTTSGGILANCIAPRKIKIGQGAEKYRFYFNVLLRLSRGSRHMAEVIADILFRVFDIPVSQKDITLDVYVDERSENQVAQYLAAKRLRNRVYGGKSGKPYVVVNLSAVEPERKLSETQGHQILRLLDTMSLNTVVIAAPADEEWRDKAVRSLGSKSCWSYPDSGTAGLREIAALVRGATAVVTPDTAVVHLASAVKTPVFGLFTPLRVTAEWVPFKVRNKIFLAEEGSPVSSISIDVLASELKKFLKEG